MGIGGKIINLSIVSRLHLTTLPHYFWFITQFKSARPDHYKAQIEFLTNFAVVAAKQGVGLIGIRTRETQYYAHKLNQGTRYKERTSILKR